MRIPPGLSLPEQPEELSMYVRVVRFTDASADRVESLLQRIRESDGPPPGVKTSRAMLLFDADHGTALSVQFYDSREDMEESAKVFEAMDPSDTPGTRVSVDSCEVKLELYTPGRPRRRHVRPWWMARSLTMHCVRIYSDEHGESHFEDVPLDMTLERYASAEWLISKPLQVDELWFRRVVTEFADEPHQAPRRQLIVGLAGEAEVEVSDGEIRRFGPGSVILVEDTTGKGHRTRRIGDTVRETLFISLPE
jgi:hypothetical protein